MMAETMKAAPFQSGIRSAQSSAPDARQAAAEFYAGVTQPEMELVVFFCSSEYDLDILADEMKTLFAGVQVVGCTTAGEIGGECLSSAQPDGSQFSVQSFFGCYRPT